MPYSFNIKVVPFAAFLAHHRKAPLNARVRRSEAHRLMVALRTCGIYAFDFYAVLVFFRSIFNLTHNASHFRSITSFRHSSKSCLGGALESSCPGEEAIRCFAQAEELGTLNRLLYPIRSIAGNSSLQSGRCQGVVNESHNIAFAGEFSVVHIQTHAGRRGPVRVPPIRHGIDDYRPPGCRLRHSLNTLDDQEHPSFGSLG